MLKFITFAFLLTSVAWASELPNAPSSSSKPGLATADGKFLFLASAYTAALVADYETTQSCLARGACRELNPVFGSHPSRLRMYAIGGAISAGTIYGSYYLKKKRKRYWWVPLVAGTVVHGYLAYRNSRL